MILIKITKIKSLKMGCYIVKGEVIYIDDMVNLVLQSIDYGSVWKNIRSVSKNIYLLSRKYQESKLIELANPILSLIYIYPENKWNLWRLVVDKSVISIDFIRLTYNKLPWYKDWISMSTGITIEDIINSDPDSIYWREISMNPSIKVSDMLKHDDLPWNYDIASDNTSIRIEDVRNNPDKEWNHCGLAANNSLSIEDRSTIVDLSKYHNWIRNENTTYEDVIKYSNEDSYIKINNEDSYIKLIIRYIPLNEDVLQAYIDRCPNIKAKYIHIQSITPNIIRNNPYINWDFTEIDYTNFTVEEVVNIPSAYAYGMYRMLKHPDFTMKDFFKYFDVNNFEEWFLLSRSSWLTFDIVLKYKDVIPWDHKGLSNNPNVTVDILEDIDFSWIEWDYDTLSLRAQLNFVYIIQNSNKDWDVDSLSFNKSLTRT